jgi:hypothetical protein
MSDLLKTLALLQEQLRPGGRHPPPRSQTIPYDPPQKGEMSAMERFGALFNNVQSAQPPHFPDGHWMVGHDPARAEAERLEAIDREIQAKMNHGSAARANVPRRQAKYRK